MEFCLSTPLLIYFDFNLKIIHWSIKLKSISFLSFNWPFPLSSTLLCLPCVQNSRSWTSESSRAAVPISSRSPPATSDKFHSQSEQDSLLYRPKPRGSAGHSAQLPPYVWEHGIWTGCRWQSVAVGLTINNVVFFSFGYCDDECDFFFSLVVVSPWFYNIFLAFQRVTQGKYGPPRLLTWTSWSQP